MMYFLIHFFCKGTMVLSNKQTKKLIVFGLKTIELEQEAEVNVLLHVHVLVRVSPSL